jgi:hypothetical protein
MHNPQDRWAIDNELANRVVQRWTFAAEADYLSVFGSDGTIKDPNSLSQRAMEVIRELEAGAKKQGQRNDLRPGKGNGNGKGKGRANGRRSGGNRVSAQAARGGGRGRGVDGDSASDDGDSASDNDDSFTHPR